jgi:hypothetical protein
VITIKPQASLEDRIDDNKPYKSREDKSIADALTQYGIPFFYKQPTLVVENGKRMLEYVDFFLPTYNGPATVAVIMQTLTINRQ